MLTACHERVQRTLGLLARLRSHVGKHGSDHDAQRAAADVLRYFDLAAPRHHEDEERHIFPALLAADVATPAGGALAVAVQQMQRDHRRMSALWAQLRVPLAAINAGEAPAEGWSQLAEAFAALYGDHIAVEERCLYPAAQRIFTDADLSRMSDDMRARRQSGQPSTFS